MKTSAFMWMLEAWSRPFFKALASQHPHNISRFDQCMFGLVSKSDVPMQKPTNFLSNLESVKALFDGQVCMGLHEHQAISGSEGGVYRTVWAQKYPRRMCEAIVDAVVRHVSS